MMKSKLSHLFPDWCHFSWFFSFLTASLTAPTRCCATLTCLWHQVPVMSERRPTTVRLLFLFFSSARYRVCFFFLPSFGTRRPSIRQAPSLSAHFLKFFLQFNSHHHHHHHHHHYLCYLCSFLLKQNRNLRQRPWKAWSEKTKSLTILQTIKKRQRKTKEERKELGFSLSLSLFLSVYIERKPKMFSSDNIQFESHLAHFEPN